MPRIVLVVLFCCLFGYSSQRSTPEADNYVAAVVEYQVNSNVEENVQNYIQHIQEAARQDADVVVFPEMTLTRGTRAASVPIYGILKQYPVPALRQDLYDEILVNISAAARQYQVYVVINIQERMDCTDSLAATGENCPEQKVYLFNTNVVFSREGAVIDRFRKINLFGEVTRTPALAPDLGVFSTDFGVTFGHFICFDLMFQVPAVQVVEKHNITDIIFTTMWFSEMPYLTAVQIQEAYAYTMDVNFIASGANNVRVGSAGSGIYSGKAGALVSIMPGVPTTRLLVSRVPKVPGQVSFTYPGPIYDNPTDQDGLELISDPSLPAHVSRLLTEGFQEFTLVDKEVTCKFRVRLNHGNAESHYKYRASAFNGVRSFSGVETGGARVCAIFACTGEATDSCGKRFAAYNSNAAGVFEEITISALVPTPRTNTALIAHDSVFFPVSLDVALMPLEVAEYTYDKEIQGDVTTYTLILKNATKNLYTLGVWGRVFEWDGLDASPPVEDEPGHSVSNKFSIVLLILGIAFLIRV